MSRYLAASKYGGISLGYRNTLLLQFCAKSGFDHLHEHKVLPLRLIWDERGLIAACVDSLLHFEPENFIGKILIIDEIVSVVKHLLFSRTIPINKLMLILQRFAQAVQLADRVICLDGLMTDWVVEYLKRICPDKKIVTVENCHQGEFAPIYYLNGTINPKTLKTKKNDKRLFLKLLNDSDALTLSGIASNVLTAEDFKSVAQEILKKVQNSKEELSYKLSLPEEKVNKLVKRLWNEGKIDSLNGGIFRKLFPMLINKKKFNPDAYFTLTSLGHFFLHPVVKFG